MKYCILTLPRVFDLRAGTVKCRLVSERQLEREVVTTSRTWCLRVLLTRVSPKEGCCSLSFRIVEAWIIMFRNLLRPKVILVVDVNADGERKLLSGTFVWKDLGGFKETIESIIARWKVVCIVINGHEHSRTRSLNSKCDQTCKTTANLIFFITILFYY